VKEQKKRDQDRSDKEATDYRHSHFVFSMPDYLLMQLASNVIHQIII
jgi:hypothetical protein